MIKEVVYNGFTCAQNDRDCQDGDLALALNVLPENKALVGIGSPTNIGLEVDPGERIWLHRTSTYEHYIYTKTLKDDNGNEYKVLYWAYKDDNGIWHKTEDNSQEPLLSLSIAEEILSIVFVGNTLVCSTSSQMYYYICKVIDSASGEECIHEYIFLGNKIPSVNIQFALDLEPKMKTYVETGITKSKLSDSGDSDEETGNSLNAKLKCAKQIGGVSFYIASDDIDAYLTKAFLFEEPVKLFKGKNYIFRTSASMTSACHVEHMELHGFYADEYGKEGVEGHRIATKNSTYGELTVNKDTIVTQLNIQRQTYGIMASGYVYIDEISEKNYNDILHIAATKENYEAVMGCINKFVADYSRGKNKFIYPFFIRYAIRLYDSSVSELSAPILMTPNSGYVPYVSCNNYNDSRSAQSLNLYAFIADLKYRLLEDIGGEWQDIVQSVDIYVSSPIYPYNEDKEFSETENDFVYKDHITHKYESTIDGEKGYEYDVVDEISDLSFGIGKIKEYWDGLDDGKYGYRNLSLYLEKIYGFDTFESIERSSEDPVRVVQLCPKDEDSIDQEIKDVSTFYLIKRITFDELKSFDDFENLEMEDGTLETLEAREALSDDNISYDQIVGGKLFAYNNRLHLFGGDIIFRDMTLPTYQVQYNDLDSPIEVPILAYVYLRTTEGIKIVKTNFLEDKIGAFIYSAGFIWLFYPDNRAFQVILEFGNGEKYKFPLTIHNFLNGACFFLRTKNGFSSVVVDGEEANTDLDEYIYDDDLPSDNEICNTMASSSIYVSEVNNPFTFKSSTVVTAGTGNIIAMAAAAQAMSQGQFGQFPVYAFTDEGVWALEVNSDGTYLSSKPISRDVCINADGVTSIDSSVVFPTTRGIMEASGSRVECITKDLDGRSYFDITQLPHYKDILDKVGLDATIYNFKKFLSTCHCIYDYTNQRIFFYSPGNNMAYVLSLKDAAWGMAVVNIATEINSYPNALAIDSDGNVIDFSSIDEDEKIPYLAITRPLKLEGTDTLKSIFNVIQRGYFRKGHLSQFLWGSRNLYDWESLGDSDDHKLTRLRGSGYKYLRIGIVGNLFIDESISGATIEMEDRLNNKVR